MTTSNSGWDEVEATFRSELTVEAFAAGLIVEARDFRCQPYWLCTSDEAKNEALARFRALYDQWVELEISTAKTRFELEQEALQGARRDGS